jgi:hypothetical protein
MNDTMSLLLATTILATGGVCLYMYKNHDEEEQTDGDKEYNEGNLFSGLGNFFSLNEDEESNNDPHYDEENEDDLEFYESKPKPKGGGGKTKRNRKNGGTKRRY